MKKYLKENVKSTWIRRIGARESRVEKVGSRARFEIRAISVPCAWCRSRESETRIGNRTREGDGRWERRACTIEASLSWTSKRFCVLPWRGVSSRAIMPSNSNRNYASDYVFPFILETLKCFVLIKTIYLFIFFFHLNLKEISSIVWRRCFKVVLRCFIREKNFSWFILSLFISQLRWLLDTLLVLFQNATLSPWTLYLVLFTLSFSISNLIVLKIYNLCYREWIQRDFKYPCLCNKY